ncbi:MAG TPA: hypothetical protein VGF54_15525 [Streptosporangiaceae bacterium]|jgi:hypothetical protein
MAIGQRRSPVRVRIISATGECAGPADQRQASADDGGASLKQRCCPAFAGEGLQLFPGHVVGREARWAAPCT